MVGRRGRGGSPAPKVCFLYTAAMRCGLVFCFEGGGGVGVDGVGGVGVGVCVAQVWHTTASVSSVFFVVFAAATFAGTATAIVSMFNVDVVIIGVAGVGIDVGADGGISRLGR